ncbi:MAG: hypothetical protein BGO69_00795 [Bacteroidetes bacterium 46-16]|nr:MAG: hypothetical protein BGO69_00795 [Bacteroidetes bacterium 46-16]
MKQLTLIFIVIISVTSCSTSTGEKQGPATEKTPPAHTMVAHRQPQADPVCDMPRESEWTDFTVYNNDTIWFCSEGCKKAFIARPGKYIGEKK